ncbi:MAG: 50S ribosomal protein L19 [Candidatus Margulisiibacteriota bacterium]
MGIIEDLEKSQIKKEPPQFKVGDTIKVYSKIIEGGKERLQGFEGIVIKFGGKGVRKNFTVRKIVQGVGVERTFPLYSPRLERIEVIKSGKVRRAKLYYLRKRIGGEATKVEMASETAAKVAESVSA